MSKPRPELGDRSRHEIRNTQGGIDLFFPNALMRWAFMFILASAARRYNIGIVAYALMPSHIHIIVNPGEDPDRPHDLPEFRKFVNSNLARFANSYWDGRRGHVFCRDSVGDSIKIIDAASELDQIAYVELNGVAAGFGRHPADLKGAMSLRKWLTLPQVVERPPMYFQECSWPETEVLHLCVPKVYKQLGYDRLEFQKLTQKRLNQQVKRVRKRVRKSGKQIQSLQRLSRKKPTFEHKRSAADHSRAWIVGQDKVAKAEEMHRLEAWWSWHADALRRLKDGEEDVVFPPGTYKAAKKYGAKVATLERYEAKVRRRDIGRLPKKYARKLLNDEIRLDSRLE